MSSTTFDRSESPSGAIPPCATASRRGEELASNRLLVSVLDAADIGIAVVDSGCGLRYANPVARRLLAIEDRIPEGVRYQLQPMLAELRASESTALERWILGPLALRARVRRVGDDSDTFVVELSVTRIAGAGDVIEALARWLGLSRDESILLTMLWRGYGNEEMSHRLGVAIGTVKSRLYRLYQQLGVSNRIGAALVAADVLGPR